MTWQAFLIGFGIVDVLCFICFAPELWRASELPHDSR